MRIVQLPPTLLVAGAETVAAQLAQELLNQGHDVHLVCLKHDGPLSDRLSPELAARTEVAGKASRYDVRVLPRMVRILRRLEPDVVHTHLFTSLSWGTVAARMAGVPVVVHTQHGCHELEYAYLPPIRRQLSRKVDALVACSDAVEQAVQAKDFGRHSRVLTIDNGIPLEGRPVASLDGQPLRVGTVGRLDAIKGQAYLVQAVGLLRDRGVDVELVLVGEGEERQNLESEVNRLGVQDRVELAGEVADVPQRLAGLDLFVLPSISEGLSMAVLEAGAAGLPLLVTSGGGGAALIEAGAGGYVVPPRDAEALADCIAKVAAMTQAERSELGLASRKLVQSNYGMDATARKYADLYRELLAERG